MDCAACSQLDSELVN